MLIHQTCQNHTHPKNNNYYTGLCNSLCWCYCCDQNKSNGLTLMVSCSQEWICNVRGEYCSEWTFCTDAWSKADVFHKLLLFWKLPFLKYCFLFRNGILNLLSMNACWLSSILSRDLSWIYEIRFIFRPVSHIMCLLSIRESK